MKYRKGWIKSKVKFVIQSKTREWEIIICTIDFIFNQTLVSGKLMVKISHFVRNDNQYFGFLVGLGWRQSRQPRQLCP